MSTALVDRLARDVRHAVRGMIRDWRFTTAAVLLVALGIAANAAIFSVVNSALLRDQTVFQPDRLVDIYQRNSNAGALDGNSYPAYRDMAEYRDVFASTMAVSVPNGVNYQDGSALRSAVVEYTTPTYLGVLGLSPSLGRWFDAAEASPGAGAVAVLSHRAWISRFNGDPSVIGRVIRIEGVPVTIVGVGPAGHNATVNLGIVTDFWLPVLAIPALGGPPRALERRPEEAAFSVKARLKDGITVVQAQAAMDVLGVRLASEYPREDPGAGISVVPSSNVRVHPQLDGFLKALASVVLLVLAFVLMIACSNLATLLLVRGVARRKDVSIRLALGATRAQLVRQLMTESLLLSVAGGAAGCLLAWWAIRSFSLIDLPVTLELALDYRVLAFVVGMSLVTGVAFGLAPALESTRIDLVPTLRDDGQMRAAGRHLTVRNALVVFQVAVSVLLLGGSSVFLQMLSASRVQRIGYAVDGVAMIQTDSRYAGYSSAEASRVSEELGRRVAALPGVQSAALTRGLAMEATGVPLRLEVDRATPEPVGSAGAIWAGPGYFDTLDIRVLYGRTFDERDRADTPRVAIINESMARQFFGGVDVLGRRFRVDREPAEWFEVVGVVRDTGTSDLSGDLVDPTPHLFYRSFTQAGLPPTTVLARTALDANSLVGALQRELRAIDGSLPVIAATTMTRHLENSLLVPKAVATLLAALGFAGVCLAAIGLYAVIAFAVSQRSREIGIRMALGAHGKRIVWSVGQEIAELVSVGTGVGLALSILAILGLRAVAEPAPGVSLYRPTADPLALVAIAALMALAGIAAAYAPARRATRMDPVAAIRQD